MIGIHALVLLGLINTGIYGLRYNAFLWKGANIEDLPPGGPASPRSPLGPVGPMGPMGPC